MIEATAHLLKEIEGLKGSINQTKVALEEWISRKNKGGGSGSRGWYKDNDIASFVSALIQVSSSIPRVKGKVEGSLPTPPPEPEGPFTTCPICQKERMNEGALILHILKAHGKIQDKDQLKGLICPVSGCSKRYLHRSKLEAHLVTKHYGEMMKDKKVQQGKTSGEGLICYRCRYRKGEEKKVYKDKEALRAHLREEHGGMCEDCGQQFVSRKGVENHFKRYRGNCVTKFKCDLCPEGFPQKNDLTDHIMSTHRDRMTTSSSSSGNVPVPPMTSSSSEGTYANFTLGNEESCSYLIEKSQKRILPARLLPLPPSVATLSFGGIQPPPNIQTYILLPQPPQKPDPSSSKM